MKKIRGTALLMILAILGITGFQAWWLKNNYDREKQALDIKTNAAFRQTILKLQSSKLKLERISLRFDTALSERVLVNDNKLPQPVKVPPRPKEPVISILSLLQEKLRDSLRKDSLRPANIMISVKGDSGRVRLIDSLRQLKGQAKIISRYISDSLLDPKHIEEVQVSAPSAGTGHKVISFGSSEKANTVVTTDSFSFSSRDNILIERHMPPVLEKQVLLQPGKKTTTGANTVFQFLYDVDSLSQKDSVTIQEIDSAYAARLKEEKINIGFTVNRLDSIAATSANAVTIGFSNPASFGLKLENTFGYMFGKLKLPILFSLLLVGLTIASFVLLYRNMLKQQRLAELKNEFISNITHELKTPIATVGVAIEALKNFNAIRDPQRTQEYLDISQNELQRLNLLVDKVLKLSMFEKKEIELKYELLNLQDIVEEVVASMKLQTEKYHAAVSVNVEGDCSLQADRLHLLSVVFNLLDNALKYGAEKPVIQIGLEEKENTVQLIFSDNGIGIPDAYKDKVFDKFFRVPHGDTHNAKGYGLGLSYVAHVVKKHKGTIAINSESGKGTTFVISLPKQHNK